jgi:hypothetical protein
MANDQRFLTDAIPQLKDYLLTNDVYWATGGDMQLTLGNLLMAEANLKAEGKLSAEDSKAIASVKKEWGTAWKKKAEREFAARLRQWHHYVGELSDDPDRHGAYYRNEVRARALLELLAEEAPGVSGQLSAADSMLKALTESADFIWDDELKGAYPKGKYWFLYAKVKAT